jgi:hypothetical protein
METNAKNNGQATRGGNAVLNDKKPQFVAGNPVNAVSKGEEGKPKDEPVKNDELVNKDVPKPAAPAEQPKAEVKAGPAKPVLNLDSTVKVVLALNRKIQHRNNLQAIVKNLDDFVIHAEEETEETGSAKFQRCELIIKDDEGRSFSTKNAGLIFNTSQYINSLCGEKITEIEAEIIIPA